MVGTDAIRLHAVALYTADDLAPRLLWSRSDVITFFAEETSDCLAHPLF